jgi:hypothetical protein
MIYARIGFRSLLAVIGDCSYGGYISFIVEFMEDKKCILFSTEIP